MIKISKIDDTSYFNACNALTARERRTFSICHLHLQVDSNITRTGERKRERAVNSFCANLKGFTRVTSDASGSLCDEQVKSHLPTVHSMRSSRDSRLSFCQAAALSLSLTQPLAVFIKSRVNGTKKREKKKRESI